MPSARRHKRIVNKKRSTSFSFFKYLIIALIPVFIFVFFKLNTKYWDGIGKVSVIVQENQEKVSVLVFDPSLGEEVELVIPGETEVDVSQNLGNIRLKNVLKLGENEGLGLALLPKTITKSFMFPVTLFSDKSPNTLEFITTKNSNIPLGDRILIMVFSKKVKNLDKSVIDLAKSQFVVKAKLADGIAGYKIPGEISNRLTFYFSDNEFVEGKVRAYIKDATGSFGAAERLGKIIEVMGGKVVTVEKSQKEEVACIIKSKSKSIANKIAKLFDCKINSDPTEFELEITLGSKFSL